MDRLASDSPGFRIPGVVERCPDRESWLILPARGSAGRRGEYDQRHRHNRGANNDYSARHARTLSASRGRRDLKTVAVFSAVPANGRDRQRPFTAASAGRHAPSARLKFDGAPRPWLGSVIWEPCKRPAKWLVSAHHRPRDLA